MPMRRRRNSLKHRQLNNKNCTADWCLEGATRLALEGATRRVART